MSTDDALEVENRASSGVRLRDAPDAGLSRSKLRGRSWARASHGVYVARRPNDPPYPPFAAIRSILPPAAMAAHLTAARLYDLWLPEPPDWLPQLAVLAPGVERPERNGLYVFRSRAGLPAPYVVDAIACVPPEVCLGQLAEDLSLLDLVIAIDSALYGGLCTVAGIERAIRSRQRGLPRLRRALALCDGRSESPWETVLRVLHVVCGIAVEPQYRVVDSHGAMVARADLRICGTSRLPEYDGAEHRTRLRQQADLAREKALSRLGYERYGYIAKEILENPWQVLRDAERALGLPSTSDRIKQWWPVLGESSLSAAGRRRLLRRLHRFDRPLRGRGNRRTPRELRETG